MVVHVGRSIPSLAFGTGSLGNGQSTIDTVDQALGTGFVHIGKISARSKRLLSFSGTDTAQRYNNEKETGTALQQSELKREDVWITTKFSGTGDIPTSIRNSVNNVRHRSPVSASSILTCLMTARCGLRRPVLDPFSQVGHARHPHRVEANGESAGRRTSQVRFISSSYLYAS